MYKVLLIDDEKILCLSMQVKVGQALKGMAHECRYALTGEAGIQESRTWKPDIAIVDFCLPDMIGNEVVRRVHEVSPDTLLIGLSAHDNYEYVRSMFIEGSFDYLLKPVPAAELKKRLRKAIQMIDTRRQLLTHEKHSELAEVICRAERMEKAAFTSALLQSGEWKKIYPYSSYSVARVAGRWDAQVRPEEIHPLLCESEEAVWQLLPCRYGDMIIILNAEKPEDSFQRMLKDFAVKAHAELYLGASEGAFMGIGGLHTALLHARRARIAHLLDEQDRVVRYLPAFGRSEHPAWNISDQRLSAPQERQNVLGRLLKLFESKEEFAKEIAALSPCEFESMYLGVLAIIHRCPIEAERLHGAPATAGGIWNHGGGSKLFAGYLVADLPERFQKSGIPVGSKGRRIYSRALCRADFRKDAGGSMLHELHLFFGAVQEGNRHQHYAIHHGHSDEPRDAASPRAQLLAGGCCTCCGIRQCEIIFTGVSQLLWRFA